MAFIKEFKSELIALAMSIVAILLILATSYFGKWSSVDSNLLSVLLFLFSAIITWIVSKIFSARTNSANLRDWGVQVAQGLLNQQNQMTILSDWVALKRASLSSEMSIVLVDAQLEHVEETLRGIQTQSNTTINSVKGVIGGALEQYNSLMQQIKSEENKRHDSVNALLAQLQETQSVVSRQELIEKISNVEQETSRKIEELARSSVLPINVLSSRSVEIQCPNCSNRNQITMPQGSGQTKLVQCGNCQSRFNVHSRSDGDIFCRPANFMRDYASSGTDSLILERNKFIPQLDMPEFLNSIEYKISSRNLETVATEIASYFGNPQSSDITVNNFINWFTNRDEFAECGVSRKKVKTLCTILFRGHLFLFDSAPSFNSIVINKISVSDVCNAFASAAGRKIAYFPRVLDAPSFQDEFLAYFAFAGGNTAEQSYRMLLQSRNEALAA